MTASRLAFFGVSSAMAGVLAWETALAHPSDWGPGKPVTYPALVSVLREEVRSIDWALGARDYPDVGLHATEIATLAREMPTLAMTLSSAVRDSALGAILRAGMRVEAAAAAVRRAAEGRDSAAVAGHVLLFADPLATLDAFAPKQYVCPMRCEIGRTYDRPLLCPVCHMHLQLVTTDRYGVKVTPASMPVRAGVSTTLEIQIEDPAGFDARELQVVHEKLLHLMVVSYDLSRFDHVHPTPGPDGRFTLKHRFPAGGRYVLFHDFTPDSVGMQVVPVEIDVRGAARPPVPLRTDDGQVKRVDGFEVALTRSRLAPGIECAMTFSLSRGGKPVTDLEPFLGAMGHLVMVSEDRASYVHSHPRVAGAPGSSSVEFRMRFTRTGIYKAWGQFQRRGRVLTVPFVVEVTDRNATLMEGGPGMAP